MVGSFGGLEIARSGMFISQKAMDVVGKNIANANTVGYSRQRIVTTPAAYNMGVAFSTVEQVRDKFLDTQYRNEVTQSGEWSVKTDALTMMEDFLQEPSDSGINKAVGNFFDSIQQLSKQPESKEFRTQVRQNAINLTETLHYVYDKFTEIQQNQNQGVIGTVSQINTIADSIKSLNGEIVKLGADGQETNELKDQRNNLLDQLSELVGISTIEQPDNTVTVMIDGKNLVDGNNVTSLKTTQDKANPISGEQLLNSIRWSDTGEEVAISGGTLKGYTDIRDGNGVQATDNPKTMGVPYFVSKLNLFAKSVVDSVNTLHMEGYTQPNESNGNVSQTGVAFFTPTDFQNDVTAKNIAVSTQIMNDVYNIAASDKQLVALNLGNNSTVSNISNLRDSQIKVTIGANTYDIGTFEGFTKEIVTELAMESANATQKSDSQDLLVTSVNNRRTSISGVSIDEEMTNMIQFQHAYSAAASIIKKIDENLDTLINRLGN